MKLLDLETAKKLAKEVGQSVACWGDTGFYVVLPRVNIEAAGKIIPVALMDSFDDEF